MYPIPVTEGVIVRIFPQELLIRRLKGTLPGGRAGAWAKSKTIGECLQDLRTLSGLDLGSDPEVWAAWWEAEKVRLDIDPDF